jgi:F0F1-type ATP synthase assembly protein I
VAKRLSEEMKSKPFLIIGTCMGALIGWLMIPKPLAGGVEQPAIVIISAAIAGLVIGLILDATSKR